MLQHLKAAFSPRPDKQQCKDAGLALVLILLIIMALTRSYQLLPWAIGALVLAMSWVRVFHPFAILWFGLAKLLGSVVSRVLLSLVFLVLVTPVGLVRRALGKDSLQLRGFRSGSGSVMHARHHEYSSADLEQPF